MKVIEVEDDLYRYIAGQTEHIGESASAILRRLLGLAPTDTSGGDTQANNVTGERVVAGANAGSAQAAGEVANISVEGNSAAEAIRAQSKLTFKRLLKDPKVSQQKAAVGRFLYLLAKLHHLNPSAFAGVLAIRGRNRIYFARSESSLLATGPSSNPKQIQGSDYWVIVNSNTATKQRMLAKVLHLMGCDAELAKQITALL